MTSFHILIQCVPNLLVNVFGSEIILTPCFIPQHVLFSLKLKKSRFIPVGDHNAWEHLRF